MEWIELDGENLVHGRDLVGGLRGDAVGGSFEKTTHGGRLPGHANQQRFVARRLRIGWEIDAGGVRAIANITADGIARDTHHGSGPVGWMLIPLVQRPVLDNAKRLSDRICVWPKQPRRSFAENDGWRFGSGLPGGEVSSRQDGYSKHGKILGRNEVIASQKVHGTVARRHWN